MDLHLLDCEEVVFRRMLEVDDRSSLLLRASVRAADRDGDAVPQQKILLLVDLQEGGSGQPLPQRSDGLVDLDGGDPGVEFLQCCADIPGQQDLLVVFPPQCPALTQHFLVVGIDDIPAQLIAKQIPRGILDEDVFGIVIGHGFNTFIDMLTTGVYALDQIGS